jgi:hypothetical protein
MRMVGRTTVVPRIPSSSRGDGLRRRPRGVIGSICRGCRSTRCASRRPFLLLPSAPPQCSDSDSCCYRRGRSEPHSPRRPATPAAVAVARCTAAAQPRAPGARGRVRRRHRTCRCCLRLRIHVR